MHRLLLIALSLTAVAAVALGGCTTGYRRHDEAARFKTAVAAPNKHYTVYWLGASFQAGGLTYSGPGAPGLGDVTDPDYLVLGYTARVVSGRGGGLDLTLWSKSAWMRDQKTVFGENSPHDIEQVTVAGHEAELYSYALSGGGYNRLLVVDLGDTIVMAFASHSIGPTPGAEAEALTDTRTLLSVMQNLRPYPQ